MAEEKSLTYEIDLANNLITELLIGEYNINDVVIFQKEISEDKRYDRPLNVLLDLRRGVPGFSVNDLDNIVSICVKFGDTSKKVKVAFVSDLPRHVVDAVIIENLYRSRNINAESKAFSTIEAAHNWLNVHR